MKLFKRKFKEPKTEANLPRNRKELFKTIFREDFGLLVDGSIVILLFSLPLFVLLGISLFIFSGLNVTAWEEITPLIFWTSVIAVPLLMLRYMGKIAIYGVIKKRVFNEAGMFNEIFAESFKDNWKKGLIIGLLVGLASFIGINGSIFIIINSNTVLVRGLGVGVSILVFFLIYIGGEYYCSIHSYYDLTTFQGLKNGVYFTIMDLFTSLLLFIIKFIVPVLLIYLSNISYYVLAMFSGLYFEGLFIVIFTLRSHTLFDLAINKDNYPEMVNYGLYKNKED